MLLWLCGRCCCHYGWWYCHLMIWYDWCDFVWQMLFAKVADGIAYQGGCGLWSDVITMSGRWNSHWVTLFYFNFSSGLLHRTSSHMWGRWYFAMFLFRDGLLTLIYKASFMILMRFWSSLHTMLKLSMSTSWPDLCTPHHTPPYHIYSCTWLHFFQDMVFILWSH